jgi:hypothetical protein
MRAILSAIAQLVQLLLVKPGQIASEKRQK